MKTQSSPALFGRLHAVAPRRATPRIGAVGGPPRTAWVTTRERAPRGERMIACTRCSTQPKKDTGTRLPRGWKRMQGDAILCPSCVDAQYVLRAITFPVASPA